MIGTQERAHFVRRTKIDSSPEAVQALRAEVLAPYSDSRALVACWDLPTREPGRCCACGLETMGYATVCTRSRCRSDSRHDFRRRDRAPKPFAKVQRVTDLAFPCGEAWDL